MWFISKFASVRTFTSTTILGSNFPEFSSSDRLNPPPNPSSSNGSELLLLFPSLKILNFSNRFAPIVLKYGKYLSSVLSVSIVLFYWLLSSMIALVVIPIDLLD